MNARPERLVVVAGTGTEVGKTWVACHLAAGLRSRGTTVAARKPAQSYDEHDSPTSPDPPADTDAALLGAATGEDPTTVCPPHRWYPVAMAPPMAADALGRARIGLTELVGELASSWSDEETRVGLVELAGGLWSPIAHDGDGLDLTRALAPETVLLVADAGLGTLNSIRPAVTALAGIAPTLVFLNRYDDTDELHRRNADWLAAHDGVQAIVELDLLIQAVADAPVA